MSGDGARVAYPLFQTGDGGSKPTSPLQLYIGKIDKEKGMILNRKWHSRLPRMKNYQMAEWYGASFNMIYFAVAAWSVPIAREFNNKNFYELRRMAIAPDAPKNTASRFLKVMQLLIKKEHPEITKLISYQDTEVHSGTIYKASGWLDAYHRFRGNEKGWHGSDINQTQTLNAIGQNSEKIRWEKDLVKRT